MFLDAVDREMQIGDIIVFYQPTSKVNRHTGVRSNKIYDNSSMGPKAKSLQRAVITGLADKPTPHNPNRQTCTVDHHGTQIVLDRFDRIAVVARA